MSKPDIHTEKDSIIIIIINLKLTEVKIFTIRNIYIAVAIPLNDKDGMLIKVNERETKYNSWRSKLRIKTLLNNIVHVTLYLSYKM